MSSSPLTAPERNQRQRSRSVGCGAVPTDVSPSEPPGGVPEPRPRSAAEVPRDTPDGSPHDGTTTDGSTHGGSTPDGSTPDGSTPDGIVVGGDGRPGCWWAGGDPDYRRYHDEEWGRPVADDVRLFEKLCLEGFQAGLSWLTILRKRENFRRAFAGFDPAVVARFGPADEARLMADTGIVRNRAKIAATVNNAARLLELHEAEGSLAAYVWRFEPADADRPPRLDHEALSRLGSSAASKALSKDLKRRGWRFVGPTTVYAFMQAMGLVNDHLEGCWVREEVEEARRSFGRPHAPAAMGGERTGR
jgi:DNA-3-methyladenine glycosylase I